ncbi:unnamed protein product [Candidula unifasciata]|uniref:Uncharacterized protein n=1 Tax=Candidula unifasciata TaxID=100452 RepID=A0A8S3YDL0_9EUPU|nr:unnamed protein product [Candidula unifasciata]
MFSCNRYIFADKAMPQRIFRLLHRARTRSQRRRVYAWIVVFSLFLILILYAQHSSVITFSQVVSREEVKAELSLTADANGDRRGPDLKLLNTDDNNNNNNGNVNNVDDYADDSRADLLPDLAPPIIHYIWCGNKHFEFRHYLSIKRADDIIRPDKIFFHYQELPKSDSEQYYTWFNQTVAGNDHIVLKYLNRSTCPESGAERYMLVLSLLEYFGGIFIPEDAILVDFPLHLRSAGFMSGVVAKTLTEYLDGIIVAKKNGFISPSSQSGLNVVLASGRSAAQGTIKPCGTIEHFNTEEQGDCICVKSRFSTLTRLAAYGVGEVRPKFSQKSTIPRIAHYICWDCEVKFGPYLSILSALYIAGLSKVYIHGVKQPTGYWWKKLQETQKVIHVYREYPEHSSNRATMTQELAEGIMRLSILLKYGGVYCDSKVIWTNIIPEDRFSYEAVASPDWSLYGSWPDSISHTTIMAKKNSEYLLKLRNLHSQNPRQQFWFVDQFLAYKMLERKPELMFLDRHLQVKCLNQNCHPTWQPGYRAPLNENPQGAAFNWQNDTLSVHWDVFPDLELETVKYTSGPIVEAARRILHKSGVSIQDLNNR